MKVAICVGLSNAVRLGCEPGRHELEIPFATISAEERAAVAAVLCEDRDGRCSLRASDLVNGLADLSGVSIVAMAVAEGRQRAEQEKKEKTEAEATVRSWLASACDGAIPNAEIYAPDGSLVGATRYHAPKVTVSEHEAEQIRAELRRRDEARQKEHMEYEESRQRRLKKEAELEEEEQRKQEAKEKEREVARLAWLDEHDPQVAAMRRKGYDCMRASKNALRSWAKSKVEALPGGLRVLNRDEECSELKRRDTPSASAYKAALAIEALGFPAYSAWATWSDPDDLEDPDQMNREAELVSVLVACPWDKTKEVCIEVTGDGFDA